jgi:hypothetical protein
VAELVMRPDTTGPHLWWVVWLEREEVVARIDQGPSGDFTVSPQGAHWSPMKRIERSFDSPASAFREVQLYFERR